ncbi:hypothetical protein LCGC14_2895480, partial [marine sediment metagenome]
MAKKKAKKESKKKSSKKNLASTLKNIQKGWKKTQPRKVGAPVPDDSYSARIESAVIEESKSSGRLQVHWELEITDGDYKGRKIHKFSGLETDDNLAFLQGDLETLELPIPEKIDDLGEVLEDAKGLLLEINVRTKEEFTNIDFIELLEDDEGEEEEEEEEEDDEEDDEASEDEDEDEAENEDEDEEEEELTKASVRKMNRDELETAIDEYDLS